MKEINKQLKTILDHIEKLKSEIEKYLSDCAIASDKKTSNHKINPASIKTFIATDEFTKIIGKKEITKKEAFDQFWSYVRKHNLRDLKDKMKINLNEPLKRAFVDKEQISQFEVPGLIMKNLKGRKKTD